MPTSRQLPGLIIALSVALLTCLLAVAVPQLSALLVAMVAGVAVRNLGLLKGQHDAGMAYAARVPLRAGIVLLGLQLSIPMLLSLGWGVPVLAMVVVTVGIIGTVGLGRLLGVERRQALLIACGFSICGAAAVAGVESTVEADEKETVTAVALVVLFGTLMIPVLPMLAGFLVISEHTAALWAGASVHEIGQVVAIGGILGGSSLGLAVTMKLARVLMLAPVTAILSLTGARRGGELTAASAEAGTAKRPPVVPLFLLGFLAAVVLRSVVPMPQDLLQLASLLQQFLLAAAMFALGAGVHVKSLLSRGGRLLALAVGSTVLVGAVGLAGATLIG
ncbi:MULTISPECIES: putative sulfate exporter family transporter [Arthrobacter]|uniref:Sulfate exporter family transporter n=2 Tax=Arthrobacter TaxID=1663 RepID=A0ABU9KGG1_9MICC|nr:putative sulfate exporter family transporter [Arthrobacter sp. YJM1]MDP5225965.1 putative sulfate exporter family transporter [Arthrobacter sp. YJM1]